MQRPPKRQGKPTRRVGNGDSCFIPRALTAPPTVLRQLGIPIAVEGMNGVEFAFAQRATIRPILLNWIGKFRSTPWTWLRFVDDAADCD